MRRREFLKGLGVLAVLPFVRPFMPFASAAAPAHPTVIGTMQTATMPVTLMPGDTMMITWSMDLDAMDNGTVRRETVNGMEVVHPDYVTIDGVTVYQETERVRTVKGATMWSDDAMTFEEE